jgi:hypothetical protein
MRKSVGIPQNGRRLQKRVGYKRSYKKENKMHILLDEINAYFTGVLNLILPLHEISSPYKNDAYRKSKVWNWKHQNSLNIVTEYDNFLGNGSVNTA